MNRKIKALLFPQVTLLIICFSGCYKEHHSNPGIFINEFLASNSGVNVDSLNYEHRDWLEIYNGYDSIVDLGNYYLTDNKKKPTKWSFPEGTKISPFSYLVIWADNQDTALHSNFKISRKGGILAIFSDKGKLVDKIKYSTQLVNVSCGRDGDGEKKWKYYSEPTPGKKNEGNYGVDELIFSEKPDFSLNAGFYESKQKLKLFNPQKRTEIRYTLNGSLPNRNSKRYVKPIKIENTVVVRAISIEKGKLPSKVATQSYFINVDKDMMVISLSSDSVALWDTLSGIYENSLRRVPRMANVEFFENKRSVINQEIEMSISGNWARYHEQKAMVLSADEKLGEPAFNYRFFSSKRVYSFRSLLLRVGGHPDKYETMFRDAMAQSLIEEHTTIDHQAYRLAVMYLNGEYWGLYNIREKTTSDFIVDNHQIERDNFDLLQNTWLKEQNGTSEEYRKVLEFIEQCDVNPENYARICSLIDINNYIDYNIIELYAANVDWPNWNFKVWKPYEEGALWKWILMDLDFGIGSGRKVDFDMISFATSPVKTRVTNPPKSTALLRKLLQFPQFKDELIQRYAVSLNVIYNPERVLKTIEKFENERINEQPLQLERWSEYEYDSPWGTYKMPQSMEEWDKEIEKMRDFARKRPDIVREHMMKKFNIPGTLVVKTNSTGGHISINSIDLNEGVLEGIYFKNYPMRLRPIPNPGKKFDYWLVNGEKVNKEQLIHYPNSNGSIEAIFSDDKQTKLPGIISANKILTKSNSPYYADSDVVISKGNILTIEKGVEILMEEYRSIIVNGGLICNGTSNEPIIIKPNPFTECEEWGALCIDSATSTVQLQHVKLIDGSWFDDQLKYKATITSYSSDVILDHVEVKSNFFPFYSEFGNIKISNSKFTSTKTCDFINIKYSKNVVVENSEFSGNYAPDTDAIDFDRVDSGIIRNNSIFGFMGFNSDGIDIGEESSNVIVEGNRIFNLTDKGVSIGQASSALIQNNIIYNCNMGVGIKDEGSFAKIHQNTFFNTKYGVAIYEKKLNAGGGSAVISNCIFSQSKKKPIYTDSLSTVQVINSVSDTKPIKGKGNAHFDPNFEDPENYNFNLKNNSPLKSFEEFKNKNIGASIKIRHKYISSIMVK